MTKNFQRVEDVVADTMFLDWYYQESEEQIKAWEQWLHNNPPYHALVNQAVAFMNRLSHPETAVSPETTESKLEQLKQKIQETNTPVVPMQPARRWGWIGAAAVLLLVIGGYTFWKSNQSKIALNTTYGQIASNQLPDGSTMILNANSTAKLSEGWENGKDREVWLDGEAFFKVTKTPQKSKFIVHTGNLDVIVTGTQFNVQHRDNKTTVLLTEGSVIIRTPDGKELAMQPGDYVEMIDKMAERKEGRADNVLAWKESMLSFDNTPLPEVARIIRNHYGVTVTLADDTVESKSITGLMPNNNLDVLLRSIELAIDIHVTRNEKGITFSTNK